MQVLTCFVKDSADIEGLSEEVKHLLDIEFENNINYASRCLVLLIRGLLTTVLKMRLVRRLVRKCIRW